MHPAAAHAATQHEHRVAVAVVDAARAVLRDPAAELRQRQQRDVREAVGAEVGPKFGWTDVAKFTLLGVPAVNYGPGDPIYAHKADEQVPVAHLRSVEDKLRAWLTS